MTNVFHKDQFFSGQFSGTIQLAHDVKLVTAFRQAGQFETHHEAPVTIFWHTLSVTKEAIEKE